KIRDDAIAEATEAGKNEQIAQKIAEGKVRKHLQENTLLHQKYVLDESKTVAGVLPEIREALPPALADSINDERRLDYLQNLDIRVRMKGEDRQGGSKGVVQVTNRGEEVVSLLAMRVVGLDDDGDPVFEDNVWAATPIQIDQDWRGPLLPGSTRRFPVRCYFSHEAVEWSHEVTEIRVWRGEPPESP
ncbi:MAG: hypothetical protein ACE5EC_07740, partial [Phycisphaerae bacterium]